MGFINFIAELLKDPRTAIASWIAAGPLMAYGCVFLIIFIETGVVFFPFLPGDSLLFASGFFAHNGGFNIVALLATAWAAAILGDQCNFMIGHFFGKKIIASGKVKAMTPERIKKSEDFLDKWGHLAIFLGRFFRLSAPLCPLLPVWAACTGATLSSLTCWVALPGQRSLHCWATSLVAFPLYRSTLSC